MPFYPSPGESQDETNSIASYKDKNQLGKLFYEIQQLISEINPSSNGGIALDISSFTGSSSSTKGVISQIYTGFETQYYIRLGSLLEYIQNRILPKYDGKYPVLKFDTGIGNYIYTIKNQVSMDPRICLINTNFETHEGSASYAREGDSYIIKVAGVEIGQVMNIYVNFMYIVGILDQLLDTKNSTSLTDFLQTILSAISNAIGGINTLEPFVDEETTTVKIIDQTPLNNKNSILTELIKNQSNSNTILNLYGYYYTKDDKTKEILFGGASFVRNFGIKTELTPELATMLTIGAQAAGSVVGEDSTALSKLNQGLEDRVKKTVTDANFIEGATQTDKLAELNDKYPNANANFTKAAKQLGSLKNATIPIWDSEAIDSYSSLQIDFLQYQEAKTAIKEDKASSYIGFIPINLNLTMDGLSGIKIYNSLNVDTTYLPSNYPATMDFIITGVSHKIESNVWTTDLSTIMVPKSPSQGQNPNSSEGGVGSAGANPGADKQYKRTKSTINISKAVIVKKILKFARSKNITDRDRLIALITIAQAESGLVSGKQESFVYSLERAKEIHPTKLKGLTDEEIKKLLPDPHGSGTQKKLANKLYGGKFGNKNDEGYKYSGKGLTQITFKENYEAMTKNLAKHNLSYNLTTNPHLLSSNQEVDVAVLVIGKIEGQFGNPFNVGINYSSNAGAIIATQNGGKKVPNAKTLLIYQKALDTVLNTDWILKLIESA